MSSYDTETDGDVFAAALRGRTARTALYQNHIKRAFDLLLVIAFLPVLLPVISILAALVALDGASPFYSQSRIGRNGESYRIWKLRTMVPDAENRLEEFLSENPEAREEWESKQKLSSDPRITPFGQMLRKSSMDELPQLYNVFKGEMSLVGPRPMMETQRALYPGEAYYALRPGITGSWQITDRNACSFAQRAVYDTEYHDSVSFATDCRILARTVTVVMRGTGC